MSRHIVLTGFEPFADFQVNPSWETARALDGLTLGRFRVKSFQIQLRYKEIRKTIEEIMDSQRPAAAISLGQSSRPVISLEKVAVNLADLTEANTLYNCGSRPKDELLDPQAPAGYLATLPTRQILDELRKNMIPAEISYEAGTFGCNQLFFHLMHKIHSDELNTVGGFIHLPCLPSQAAQLQETRRATIPSMELTRMINAVEIALKTTADNLV